VKPINKQKMKHEKITTLLSHKHLYSWKLLLTHHMNPTNLYKWNAS